MTAPLDATAGVPDVSTEFDQFDLAFEDTSLHCFEAGSGRPVILLHGSGAGCATLSNFRRVMVPLASNHRVIAADLVGFGRSGLRKHTPYFDMEMWVRQLRFLLDRVGDGAICVGHSLSGAIVLKAAVVDPRIAAVVTTGTNGWIPESSSAPNWRFPESRDQVRAAVERTFYDPRLAEEEEVDRRMEVLRRPGYRAYFEEMFSSPSSRYLAESELTPEELGRIACPVSLLHGLADRSFAPEDTSIPISRHLSFADLHIFAACAHSVAHERASDFLAILSALDERLGLGRDSEEGRPDSEL